MSGSLITYVSDDNASGTNPLNGVTFLGDVQGGTFANLKNEDKVVLDIDDATNEIDYVAEFTLPRNALPISIEFTGFLQSTGDTGIMQAYDHVAPGWETLVSLFGIATTVSSLISPPLGQSRFVSSTGKVYVRFISTAPSANQTLVLDRLVCTYETRTVGYSNGAIWVDTGATGTAAESFVDGTADNPCLWADALLLSAELGIKRFHIANDNTITLDAPLNDVTIFGSHWYLALGGQSINDSHIEGAALVTGIGSATSHTELVNCILGAGTYPPGRYLRCGIGDSDGLFTAASAGQYVFVDCYSVVAGSGSPDFDFSGIGSAVGINNRRWAGGVAFVLDSDCTLSHEVLAGGGTAITTGGADVEIRGITRSIALTLSGAGTVQFVGTTGPITMSGTTTATVNLHGVATSVADTTSAATLNDNTLKSASLEAILADTGTDGVAISTATAQAIADELLKRGVVNVEDTADAHSLAAIILATLESEISGQRLTIRKTTGEEFTRKTLRSNPNADPIVSIT